MDGARPCRPKKAVQILLVIQIHRDANGNPVEPTVTAAAEGAVDADGNPVEGAAEATETYSTAS